VRTSERANPGRGAGPGRAGRAAAASGAVLAVWALGACSGSVAEPPRQASTAEVADAEVTCPGGIVNFGTPDSAGEGPGVIDLRENATAWADTTGFSARFPAATVSVRVGEETAHVRFTDGDHRRAELTYRRVGSGWAIDALEYC
jgi:hypothetical protein